MTAAVPAGMTKTAYTKKPEGERTVELKTRRCLKCGTAFESAWVGERVCSKCKSSSDWRSGVNGVPDAWNH